MSNAGLHENLGREEAVVGPTDRKFGLTIGSILVVIAAWRGLVHGSPWAMLWGALAIFLIGSALTKPTILAPLNKAWLKLGLLLHRIMNPLIMGLLFYFTILPIGLILRRKDLLRLRWDAEAETYWLPREGERPPAESMPQQF